MNRRVSTLSEHERYQYKLLVYLPLEVDRTELQ